MERTHVSSVSQRAFFQPMSPQALQQHRGTHHSRPGSQTVNPRPYEEEYDEDQSQTHTEFSGPASVRTRPQFNAPALPPPPTQSQLQQPAGPDSRTTGFRKSITHQDSSSSPLTGKTFELSENASLQAPPTPRSGYRFPGEKASSFVDPADDEITLAPESVASNDKNYKHFKAGRLFFFGGLLQTSKDRPFVLVTLIAILVPAALFFAYPGRLLWTQSSGGPAVTIIFALIFLHCMSAFAHASFSDPGILPHNIDRNPPLKADADPLTLGPPQERWVAVPSPMAKMGAFEVPCKFCKTCCIWRPPRCYHCGICDTCVDTLDHHCVWLNNCIGRRNYVHFLTFLVSLIVLSIYLAAASIAQVATVSGVTLAQAANDTAGQVALALFAYGILGACYPASLLGYHVFLMARGETTREYLNNRKRPATERYRPFSTGSWGRNLISVVCRPVPPVALQFSGKYTVGDQRFEKGL